MTTPTKITIDSILAKVKGVRYTLLDDGRTTLCQLTLENGYTVLGTSAVVDKINFDLDIGQKLAFKDAIDKVWPLEGYLLAEQMHLDRKMQASPSKPLSSLT